MYDANQLREKAREYVSKAQNVIELEEKQYLTRMAKSYLLMAKNADWLKSNNAFLDAARKGKRLPAPGQDTETAA
jgi:hypothetical protein